MSSPLLAWDDIVQLPVRDFAGTECKIDKIKADQVAGAFGELAEQHLSADFSRRPRLLRAFVLRNHGFSPWKSLRDFFIALRGA